MHYDAFISYRHLSTDRQWAKWLANSLESYRIPRRLVKEGCPRKLSRIFRDEDELPTTPNLPQDIKNALQNSGVLIVVCSKNTPQSLWIKKEVEAFIQSGRRHKVFTLLIEGEPRESIPPNLMECEQVSRILPDGKEVVVDEECEPLAADVRPRAHETIRSLKRLALLRLVAGIIGCPFDALRQREAERSRRRRRTLLAFMFSGLLICMLAVWFHSRSVQVLLRRVESELYYSTISLAQKYYNEGEGSMAMKILGEAPAMERNWEWGYVSDLADRSVYTLRDGTNQPEVMAFDSTGMLLAVGADDGRITEWNMASGKKTKSIMGHDGPVSSISYSSDNRFLMTSSYDASVKIWNANNGNLFKTLNGHSGIVWSARFSFDNSKVLTASEDGTAVLWDVSTGDRLFVMRHNTNGVRDAIFRPVKWLSNGSYGTTESRPGTNQIISLTYDGIAYLWDVSDGGIHVKIQNKEYLDPDSTAKQIDDLPRYYTQKARMDVDEMGDMIALTFRGQALMFSDFQAWELDVDQFMGPDQPLYATYLDYQVSDGADDYDTFIYGTNSTSRLIDHIARSRWWKMKERYLGLLRLTPWKEIQVWVQEDGARLLRSISAPQTIDFLPSSNGRDVFTINGDATVAIYDIITGERCALFSGHEARINALAQSTNGYLASASRDGTVKIWDVAAANPEIIDLDCWDSVARWSEDGAYILIKYDNHVCLLDWRTGFSITDYCMQGGYIEQFCYVPKTKTLAVLAGGEIRTGNAESLPIPALGMGNCEGYGLVGARESGGAIEIFSVLTTQHISAIKAVNGRAAIFSPGGINVVIIDSNQNASVWAANSGRYVGSLGRIEQPVPGDNYAKSVMFSGNGEVIVTTHGCGSFSAWRMTDAHQIWHNENQWDARVITIDYQGRCLAYLLNNNLYIVDLKDDDILSVLEGMNENIVDAAFSPDSTRVASVSENHAIKIWDVQTGRELISITGSGRDKWAIDYSPDGHTLMTASTDGTICVWEAMPWDINILPGAIAMPWVERRSLWIKNRFLLHYPSLGLSSSNHVIE